MTDPVLNLTTYNAPPSDAGRYDLYPYGTVVQRD